jgi:hypothetical protein
MSTDVTRGPKVCPSCGKENPPTAARCWLCFTPLGGAIQTTTASAPGEERFSAPLRRQPPEPLRNGCATAAAWTGVAILTIISAGVTFILVCTAAFRVELMLPPSPPRSTVAMIHVSAYSECSARQPWWLNSSLLSSLSPSPSYAGDGADSPRRVVTDVGMDPGRHRHQNPDVQSVLFAFTACCILIDLVMIALFAPPRCFRNHSCPPKPPPLTARR